ncbi:MAG: type II toxin-antitoxin system mRNA interferase toxin, RelE/StbE family [Minisyncoccia bacterium]
MNIDYSPEFYRRFKKLPQELKIKAVEREKVFRKDQFDPRLKTHKLAGKLAGKWAFWIDHKNRIMFSFVERNLVYFHTVGGHDIYK